MSGELTRLKELFGDLDEAPLLTLVKERVAAGENPTSIVEACREGMGIVGARYSSGEYYVSDLIVSGELFNEVTKLLPSLSAAGAGKARPKIVFGTAHDDIHNIGKDIVVNMLRCNGYEVYDLGVDVPPEKFVEKVRETGARIVGISGLLTTAFASMEATIQALKDAGLHNVKVMIGGGMINELVCEQVGADAWGKNPMEAIEFIKSQLGG